MNYVTKKKKNHPQKTTTNPPHQTTQKLTITVLTADRPANCQHQSTHKANVSDVQK